MLCFHLSGTFATLVAKQPTIPCITCLASPLLFVNVLQVQLTTTFFQNYWWSHITNVNMVVTILLLTYTVYMTLILLTFAVPLVFYFFAQKAGHHPWHPFSSHDARKISYVLFCNNKTAIKIYPYMDIFPLAQSVHLFLEHNASQYNRK